VIGSFACDDDDGEVVGHALPVRSLDHDLGNEVPDPHRLDLKTWVNGRGFRQNASTSDLIFDTDAIIEHLSTAFTLRTRRRDRHGTPSGVGLVHEFAKLAPPTRRRAIEITGLGVIEKRVVDEARVSQGEIRCPCGGP